MIKTLRSGPDDDLGLPWDRLGDGRVWRLKRGVDYHVDTKALARAAEVGASSMAKVACVAAESIPRARYWDEYAWIQFVDHDVLIGSPCPCGSTELVRRHPQFARCPACGAHLKLSAPQEEEQFADDADPSRADGLSAAARSEASWAKAIDRGRHQIRHDERFALDEYADVRFFACEHKPRRDRFYGRAVDPLGMRVLIWVQYRLQDGERILDEQGRPQEPRVYRWPIPPFGSLIDLERMGPEPPEPVEGQFSSAHHRDDREGRARLHRFTGVKLVYREELPGRERFFGHALDENGSPSLIYVDYPLLNGERVGAADDSATELHSVYRWPLAPFGAVLDLDSLSP